MLNDARLIFDAYLDNSDKNVYLTKTWIDKVAQLPETGMGYQKVDISLKNGEVLKNTLVLNGHICKTKNLFTSDDISSIKIS